MYSEKDLMILYAMSSTHVGSGDNLNYIDLPIQREKHTNLPKIEASSLKGSIRQSMESQTKALHEVAEILGSNDAKIPSAVSFSDAKILFLPIKSAKGVFAYATCPLLIKRFISDCKITGIDVFNDIKSELVFSQGCYVTDSTNSLIVIENNKKKYVVLDEYIFDVQETKGINDFNTFIEKIQTKIPENDILNEFNKRAVLISDNDFSYFSNNSTEVVTRIKIGDNGTVDEGALFTQENLPPETILYSLLFFTDIKVQDESKISLPAKDVKDKFNKLFGKDIFQIGGDATLGKGLFYKTMWNGVADKE